MKFYEDNAVPLVGEISRQNEEKRYIKRPLVMVFYGVDFGFEHREGTELYNIATTRNLEN